MNTKYMFSSLQLCAFIVCFVLIIDNVSGLSCWKCIQHDCDTNPQYNYKAKKVSCKEGESCLKVRYQMYDNITYFDATTRTCSSGKCVATSEEDYETCLNSQRKYIVSGCSLRKCCDDKDLCNSARTGSFYLTDKLMFTVLMILNHCLK